MPSKKPFRIFCIEDEEPVCKLLVSAIDKGTGIECAGFATVLDGVFDHITKHQPDMLLLDLHINDELCTSLIRDIRGLGNSIKQPIIILVSREDLVDVYESLGADGSMKKGPQFKAEHLLQYIEMRRVIVQRKGVNMLNNTKELIRYIPTPDERIQRVKAHCIKLLELHHADRVDLEGYQVFIDLVILGIEFKQSPSLVTVYEMLAARRGNVDIHALEQSLHYFVKNAIQDPEWMDETGNPFAGSNPQPKVVYKHYYTHLKPIFEE